MKVTKRTTTRQAISRYLNRWPNKTAWQISQAIDKSVGLVSAVLAKDAKEGRVRVSRSKGPRGGKAYVGYKTA
jgi:hypothetical protein